ncbi:hypothetical protein Tco_1528568 [Tanacetum coccineum]
MSFNPNNYVPTDNENVDDKEYERINKEMYDDVNVELKYKEPANEEKGDEEMTHAENVNAEHEEVSQEVAGDQVKDDAQTTVLQIHTTDLSKEHSIPANVMEKLKQKYKPQKSVEDIRKVKMEKARKHQETRYTITLFDSTELQKFDQKRTLFKTMTKTKSFNKKTKHKALYHALIESILEDEDAMDKGLSAQAEETMFEAGDTQVPQDLREDIDPEWNEGKIVDNKPTQKWLSDLAKAETSSKTLNDLMSTPINFSAFIMNRLQISDLT